MLSTAMLSTISLKSVATGIMFIDIFSFLSCNFTTFASSLTCRAEASVLGLGVQGATLVDRIVTVFLAENYVAKPETEPRNVENTLTTAYMGDVSTNTVAKSGRIYVSKAQEVVSNMIAKGSSITQDTVNKAKAFDEKHQFRANAAAKVNSFDKRVGLTEKLTIGISVVSEKVKDCR